MNYERVDWPEGKRFAFTIFDDTDLSTVRNVKPVYDFLAELGFRTTKSVWPVRCAPEGEPEVDGSTCADPEYLDWVFSLRDMGFEIGYHLATSRTSERTRTEAGLRVFDELFGSDRIVMANHYLNEEAIYFGADRVTGVARLALKTFHRLKGRSRISGHEPGSPLFWGDLCHKYIKYARNFVYADINTLKMCPEMPYHDPARPYVRRWFASSEGQLLDGFNSTLREENQDQLAAEGGACIMYTHLATGFFRDGRLDPRFESLMRRLSRMGGWYVPVGTLLDHLESLRGEHTITPEERSRLERSWLFHKWRVGPS